MIHDIEGTNVTTGDTDWRAADPPVCPACGCSADYATWERRDLARSLARDNAALRERVTRLLAYAEELEAWLQHEDTTYPPVTINEQIADARKQAGILAGDLDDPATPGTEAER